MKRQIQFLMGGVILLATTTAMAYLYQGNYNWNGRTFYVNGQGAYCEQQGYDPAARQMSRYEYQEMTRMRFDGFCSGYLKGPVNYRGRSYYVNGVDAYCEYPQYHYDFREIGQGEARQMFSFRFDGICR